MQNLYQGGQCNPNVMGATSNQFKRAMNTMMIGGQNPERVLDFAHGGQNFEDEILQRQIMFKNMNSQWQNSSKQVQAQHAQMQGMMNAQFSQAMLQQQQQFQAMQQMHWMKAQEELKAQQHAMMQHFENVSLAQQAEQWKNQLQMGNQFDNAKLSYEQEQANILNSSSSMLDVMMNDPDPRFQNSQFLQFLKKVKTGELIIEGKELRAGKPEELMEGNWNKAEKQYEHQMNLLDNSFKSAEQKQKEQTIKAQQKFQETWNQKLEQYEKDYADHQNFQKMLQQKYMSTLKEMNIDLTQSWQAATNLQEELVYGDIRNQYIFNKENPYIDVAFPKKLALEMINVGKNNEAVLALEAHLAKNMEDAESWRILGKILQENDQDQKSIPCFINCLKHSPQNLDCLLSLGVSCANVLDQVKAMNFLKRWIMLNPKYKVQGIDHIIPDQMINEPTYQVQTIKNMNQQLIKVFDDVVRQNPNDPQLLEAFAILFFIKRDYDVSIDLFRRALNLDPTNYHLMNKVGATLAHLGQADEAISFYHQALDIRPNFVKVWINIGIAHAFKNLYDEAARFYLNALSFRPDAKHVWSYLHTCFMSLQRYDLINQISSQNPHSFTEFQVINLNDLPQPQINYAVTTEKHILNRQAQQWLQEFGMK